MSTSLKKYTFKMHFKLILLIFSVTQVIANTISNKEYYYPLEDNGELLLKSMFTKLNTILRENQQMSKNFMDLNKRLDDLSTLLNDKTLELANYIKSPDQQENFTKQTNESLEFIKKSLKESLNKKLLNQNNQNSWLVIQRRQDGSLDFRRNWVDYKKGFGDPNGEFFIGLEKLHTLTTTNGPQELWIILKDFNNQTHYAIYDKFVIGSEAEQYTLKELSGYRGTAGDALSYHRGQKFTTIDSIGVKDEENCAKIFNGAWWFKNGIANICYHSHLNGPYTHAKYSNGYVAWGTIQGWNHSLKFVEMLIRSAT